MYYYLFLCDIIEIAFYSSLIYIFCLWLKKDKTKHLVVYFFSYCILVLMAWAIELPTLTLFLYTYAPIALIFFIVLHEKTLQRNFVALQTITQAQPKHEDWLDIVLSTVLATINNNKGITIVIENRDSLDYFLETPFFINAPINKDIFNILLASSCYEEHKIVWVTDQGNIRSINAIWRVHDNTEQSAPMHHLFDKQSALFYSLQCDTVIIHSNQFTRNFTLICNGIETHNISAHEIKHTIKKLLSQKTNIHKKGLAHENHAAQKHLSQ